MGRQTIPARHDGTDSAGRAAPDPYAVTYHAVTRYVQRILNVVVDHGEAGGSARLAAERHCAAAGTTIDEVRRTIMSPAIATACAMGGGIVGTSRFRAVISATGTIVTIEEPWKVGKAMARKRLQVMSRPEFRRKAQQRKRRGIRAGEE